MRLIKLHRLLIIMMCLMPTLVYGLVLPDDDANLDLYRSEYRSTITPVEVNNKVLALSKYLQDSVISVRVSYYIKNRDWVNLKAELAGILPDNKVQALIDYESGSVLFPQLELPKFFTAIGEVDINSDLTKFNNKAIPIVVPVYNIDLNEWNIFIEKLEQTNLQIIPAFDFKLDVNLFRDGTTGSSLIMKLKGRINKIGKPLVHSAILLWGRTNIENMKEWPEAPVMAKDLYATIKVQWPDLFLWRQICIMPDYDNQGNRLDEKWAKDITVGDGDWWMLIHSYPAFKIEGLIYGRVKAISKDRPVVLGGFYGSYPDFEIGYAKAVYSDLVAQWNREGWAGVCLMRPECWLQVIK